MINFLVNNPHGNIFLKVILAFDVVKDVNLLFKYLDDIVDEVGEEHVVRLVTINVLAYKMVGQKLMERRQHIYWSLCIAHCLNVMLEKIGELSQNRNALLKARKISTNEVRERYGVGVWKAIRNGWEDFKVRACFRVGFGNMVKFYKDRWCRDFSLRDAFPNLFSIASFKDTRVVDAWEGGSYNPRFIR